MADGAFVLGWGWGADAVAGEFGDEEAEVFFPVLDYLEFGVVG